MAGTPNLHDELHDAIYDLARRDGVIDPQEQRLLMFSQEVCLRMKAAHGLSYRTGGIARDVQRAIARISDLPPAA